MLFDFLSPVIAGLFKTGMDKWKDDTTFKTLRLAIRDRLRREARLNAELLRNLRTKEIVASELLSTKALEEIFQMPIPVVNILDKELSDDVKSIFDKNKQHKKWAENIKTESDLVERLWQRTRMFQIRMESRTGKPDTSYLQKLNAAMAMTLAEKDKENKGVRSSFLTNNMIKDYKIRITL